MKCSRDNFHLPPAKLCPNFHPNQPASKPRPSDVRYVVYKEKGRKNFLCLLFFDRLKSGKTQFVEPESIPHTLNMSLSYRAVCCYLCLSILQKIDKKVLLFSLPNFVCLCRVFFFLLPRRKLMSPEKSLFSLIF